MAVRVQPDAGAGIHGRAFGIGDALVGPGRVLAGGGQVNGLLRRHGPGVPEIQVGKVLRHQFGIGQAAAGVVLGVAGDVAGPLHDLVQGSLAQVRAGRRALALAEIHRDRQAPVAVVLQGLHLAQAHGGAQRPLVARGHLHLVGALPSRVGEHALRHGFQLRAHPLRVESGVIHESSSVGKRAILSSGGAISETAVN